MPDFDNCPLCPKGSRPVPLIGGKCAYHWKNPTEKVERTDVEPKQPPIKKVSDKRKKLDQEYTKKKKAFMVEHPKCGVAGCKRKATDIHHTAGKVGDNYLDTSTWLQVCRPCHTWIEENPTEAKKKGYSVSRLKRA